MIHFTDSIEVDCYTSPFSQLAAEILKWNYVSCRGTEIQIGFFNLQHRQKLACRSRFGDLCDAERLECRAVILFVHDLLWLLILEGYWYLSPIDHWPVSHHLQMYVVHSVSWPVDISELCKIRKFWGADYCAVLHPLLWDLRRTSFFEKHLRDRGVQKKSSVLLFRNYSSIQVAIM